MNDITCDAWESKKNMKLINILESEKSCSDKKKKKDEEDDLELLLDEGDSSEEFDALFDKCQKGCDDAYEKCNEACDGDSECEDDCAQVYNDCSENCADLENVSNEELDEAKDTNWHSRASDQCELDIEDLDDPKARHQEERDEDYMSDQDDEEIDDELLGEEAEEKIREQNLEEQVNLRFLSYEELMSMKRRASKEELEEIENELARRETVSEKRNIRKEVKKLFIKELAQDEEENCEECNMTESKLINESIAGKSFCITGTLTIPRKEAWDLIEGSGGIVHPSVRRGTNFLVTGADIGYNKIARAQSLGVTVIDEKEFWHLVRGGRRATKTELKPWRGQGSYRSYRGGEMRESIRNTVRRIFNDVQRGESKKNLKEDVEINIPAANSTDLYVGAELSPESKQEIIWKLASEIASIVGDIIENNEDIRKVYGYETPRKSEIMRSKTFDFVLAELERS